MDFMELAQKRYSVRKFADRPVEAEKLAQILAAGRIAPTAKNQQPQRIYVLQSAAAMAKLAELSPCVYGAPLALVFTYDRDEEWQNPYEEGVHSGVEDVSIVATHVMLQATELGLGTCWCNMFPNSKLEEALGLPKNERSVLFLLVGYAAPDAAPAPRHEECKDLATTVKYL